MSSPIRTRLAELGHALPPNYAPAANYVSCNRSGNLVFIAGQISMQDGEPAYVGKVGRDLDAAAGCRAAQLCALALLAQIESLIDGDLQRLVRVVRIGGFVNTSDDFSDHSAVMNGASDLLVQVLGERGRHARTSVGVASLPAGVAVEVDAIIELAA